MRNPFRRRRRVPCAEAEWDESEHIDIGDDHMATPAEQLPAEAMARLERVMTFSTRDEPDSTCVLVNIDAVQAELDEWLEAQLSARYEPSERELKAANYEVFDNLDHWVTSQEEVDPDDDETQYSVFRVNVVTGRIGEPPD